MTGTNGHMARKVLLAEFNEITWRIVDPLCDRGKLPIFAELIDQGVRGSPIAPEVPPDLDPWISWTTLYTGRPQSEHGVRFLEQPPETVTGPRIWEIAADAGKTIGVFGSIMSWPPRQDIKGFWVPGTFSPGPETFPPELQPIQELNLTATRQHTPLAGKQKKTGQLWLTMQLRKLGLKTSSVARAISFLVRSRLRPNRQWEKVSLQPLINLDFFEVLYRRYHPDLATFHTNHAAHYQHRYWRSMDSTPFHVKASPEEVRKFGQAVEFGYRSAEKCLARMMKLVDDNTVLILASGLGQQPYVVDDFKDGRQVVRIRDINQLIELCGLTGHCTPLAMMAPQWNVKIPDPTRRAHAEKVLATAYYRTPETGLISFETVADTICLNIFQNNLKPLDLEAPCVFPEAGSRRFTLGQFCAVQDATPKEGHHDPMGLMIMTGAGVRKGSQLKECSTLDIAPTILHLIGLPIPSYMKGRVLEEAFQPARSVSVSAAVPSAETLLATA
jgi:Type I phosphodiesterase / nucleotide pyrophosphatase